MVGASRAAPAVATSNGDGDLENKTIQKQRTALARLRKHWVGLISEMENVDQPFMSSMQGAVRDEHDAPPVLLRQM
jgi:hypothetical protein